MYLKGPPERFDFTLVEIGFSGTLYKAHVRMRGVRWNSLASEASLRPADTSSEDCPGGFWQLR